MPLYKYPYKGKYKDYIADWGNDRDCEIYEQEVDDWINQFTDEQAPLLLNLLKKFRMYRGHYYDLCVKKLFKIFVNKYSNWQTSARFFEVKKDRNRVNNSDAFFLDFWRLNELKWFCKIKVKETLETNHELQQIVIVDDFAGTGQTIKDYLANVISEYPDIKEKKIVILLLACTNLAEQALLDFSYIKELKLDIIYEKKYDKVFVADSTTTQAEVEESKKNYLSICKEFGLNYALGYEDTEALIAFDYNTPNNTLGIFWEELYNEDTLLFKGLKPRKTYNRIKPQLKKSIKCARSKKLDFEAYRYILFSYVCIYSKKRFNKTLIKNALGLSNQQFWIRLDFCLISGYIKNERGVFTEGDKLKDLKISSSLKNEIKYLTQRLLDLKKATTDDLKYSERFKMDVNYIFKGFKY